MNRHELVQLLGLSNEFKEGDLAIGIGTADEAQRRSARRELGRIRMADIFACDVVEDELSGVMKAQLVEDKRCLAAFNRIRRLHVDRVRDAVVAASDAEAVSEMTVGMTSEMIAAVAKTMSSQQLLRVSSLLFNPLGDAGRLSSDAASVGARECFGSRIQPNSPTDDPTEILYSVFEGLSYGCGDVILGINPANDTVDEVRELENLLARVVERLKLPTRWSVLSDMKKQKEAMARGARVDVGFQSLAGTSKAVYGMLECNVGELLDLCRSFKGLYFETGQGSEFTNGADGGVDMVTLESRTYGLARLIAPQGMPWGARPESG